MNPSGQVEPAMRGHEDPVFSVMFSPDGKRILSGCWDQSAKLWDAEAGVELFSFGELEGPILSAVFSPDGKRIAVGGGAPGRIADATVYSAPANE